ncbi:MAG: outer membrane lipoprotein-sorting protein [Nitrospinota bacterium]|nr:outer membrane lipoprotein-sorting protein [Nitrospinota bacterium]
MMEQKAKRFFLSIAILLVGFVQPAASIEIDPEELLKALDDNLWSKTKIVSGRLIIDNGRRARTLEVDIWMEGTEKSYSYYKSPVRERGTQMLKLFRKLWMYTPRTDRKILIAGHLLRQSMMGSDLSYEDMMEDRKLSRSYKAKVEKAEEIDGVKSLVLFLKANDETITYQTRRVWADADREIVLREERYAKSGKLLKRVQFLNYRYIQDRLFPKEIIFRDMLKKDTKTIYAFDEIQFDVEVPKKYFSQKILKR